MMLNNNNNYAIKRVVPVIGARNYLKTDQVFRASDIPANVLYPSSCYSEVIFLFETMPCHLKIRLT